jgi:PAS domain S-box-containing protein
MNADQSAESLSAAPSETTHVRSNNNGDIRILLVEDDADSGRAIRASLEGRGFAVTLATDADKAISLFAPDSFDAIVMDVRLPDMNGIDLLGAIRERDAEFPVILISAYLDLEPARKAVRLGASDFILKPFGSIEDVITPVERAVRRRRLLAENGRLSKEIERSESTLRSILASVDDLVFVFDADGRFVRHYSPARLELYKPSVEFIGKKHAEVMPPHIDKLFAEAFGQCRAGRAAGYEYALEVAGKTQHWQAKLSPILSDGRFSGVVAVIRDITGIKRVAMEIVEANRREREKFGWDLHDSLGHELAGVECSAVVLRKLLGTGRNRKTKMADQIVEHLQIAKDMLRRAAKGLVPTDVAKWGLADSLKQLVCDMREFFETDCSLKVGNEVMACDEHVKEQVYYMVCEATANAVKHGDAKKIWIELGVEGRDLRLTVGNNGKCPAAEPTSSPQGVGVEIMRTRAEMLGGRFSLQCDAKRGVTITCAIPCRRRKPEDGGGK